MDKNTWQVESFTALAVLQSYRNIWLVSGVPAPAEDASHLLEERASSLQAVPWEELRTAVSRLDVFRMISDDAYVSGKELGMCDPEENWVEASAQKSYGGIQVARTADSWISVRKGSDPDGPVLRYSPFEWRRFLGQAKRGAFDSYVPKAGPLQDPGCDTTPDRLGAKNA
jgi:hypothetical protein